MPGNRERQRPPFPRIDRSHPLANGLVFGGLGGGASTLLYADASGYGNNGTLTNMGPTDWVWEPELNRYVNNFVRASSQYILLDATANQTVGSLTGHASVSFWFRSNGDYTNAQMLFGTLDAGGSQCNIAVSLGYTDNKIEGWNYAWGPALASTASISTDAWRHVVFTRSGATGAWNVALYLNGALDNSTTSALEPFSGASPAAIGRWGGFPSYYYEGKIADVLVYNRALNAAEIQQLADPSNVMLSGLILPPRRRLWGIAGEAPPAPTTSSNLLLLGVG